MSKQHTNLVSFRNEFPLLIRQHLSKTENPIEESKLPNRSQSLNRTNSTVVKRHWICQICQSNNLFSSQICVNCNSNQQSNNEQNRSIENGCRRSVLIMDKYKVDEDIVSKQIENLFQNLSLSNQKFEDESFSATNQSLFINGQSLSQTTLDLLANQQNQFNSNNQIIWLRPQEIIPPDWSLNQTQPWTLYRNPKANDVIQGALGDCWFITALSVLAEQPKYLMKVLTTKQMNEQGLYSVRLCKDGEWTQVFVDDRFPCTSNKHLAYSQCHRKQLWVPLIEKALAKLNGTYESIIAGRCCEGLAIVTGSPCETVIFSELIQQNQYDRNQIWFKLVESRRNQFLMCAMCSNDKFAKQTFENLRLLNNHAYSLQDIYQSDDSIIKLIKLRNPWGGNFRWNGEWSDKCPLWDQHPQLKKDLLKEKSNRRDGVFWMPFEAFLKYFECVDICKIRPDWYEIRDHGDFYPNQHMSQAFHLNIHQPTQIDISLFRKIDLNLRIQRSELSLCIAIVNVQHKSNGHLRIYSIPIVTQRGQHKFVSTQGLLQPGNYLILPFLFNPTDKPIDNSLFNLAIHSSSAIELIKTKINSTIQREFLIKLCLFYGERVAKTESNRVQIVELKSYWDGLILLVENFNLDKYVHFDFRCTLSQNASISRKDSNYQLLDVIPPMHRQIICTISRKNASHSFTIAHDFQFHISTQKYVKHPQVNKIQHWPLIDESATSEDIHLPQQISTKKK